MPRTLSLPRLPGESAFRWFLAGNSISLLGSSMAPLALAFAVLDTSGRVGDLGAVLAARSIPLVIFVLVGGALADRFPRSSMLQISNIGAAATQSLAAALFLSGNFHLGSLMLLEFLNGSLTALSSPAQRGIVPQLVAPGERQAANVVLAVSKRSIAIVGPAAGGVIIATAGGGWALAIDALSFVVAAICLRRVRIDASRPPAGSSLFVDLREGWSQFSSKTWLWSLVVTFGLMNFVLAGAWFTLGPVLAGQSIGAVGWGLVLSVQTMGMLAMVSVLYRFSPPRLLLMGQMMAGLPAVPMIALGLNANLYWMLAAAAVAGLGIGAFGIAWETALQQHVPNHLLSRVASYDELGSFATIPLGQLSVAPIAAGFGSSQVVLTGGILFLLISLAPIALPSVRHLTNRPTDSKKA